MQFVVAFVVLAALVLLLSSGDKIYLAIWGQLADNGFKQRARPVAPL